MDEYETKQSDDAMIAPAIASDKTPRGAPKMMNWGNRPRPLRNGLARPHEILLNTVSILLACLLFVYIAFLAAFDGAIVEDVEQAGSFLREMSQLVSTTATNIDTLRTILTVCFRGRRSFRSSLHSL